MDSSITNDQLVVLVRSFTTPDQTALSDDLILLFAGRGNALTGPGSVGNPYQDNVYDGGATLDVNGVIADCWANLALSEPYNTQTVGGVTITQPVAPYKAMFYLGLSRKGGASVTEGYMVRGDLIKPLPGDGLIDEFGLPSWLFGDRKWWVGGGLFPWA